MCLGGTDHQEVASKAANLALWICIVGELGSNAHTFIVVA